MGVRGHQRGATARGRAVHGPAALQGGRVAAAPASAAATIGGARLGLARAAPSPSPSSFAAAASIQRGREATVRRHAAAATAPAGCERLQHLARG